MEPLELDVEKRLRGPNSDIITIAVAPKWNVIQEKILKAVEGWKKFPNKLCQEWRCRLTSDYISGLFTQQAEYSYRDNESPEICPDVQPIAFSIPAADSDLAPNEWEFKELKGQDVVGHFVIGFKMSGTPDPDVEMDEALGMLDLGAVIEELRQMDAILLGAALQCPIKLEKIRTGHGIKYDPARNPRKGFHIFENEFITIGVQLRSFRGVFTRVEDYENNLAEELDTKYYGKKPVSEEVKELQLLLKNLYHEAPKTPWSMLGSGANIQTEAKEWPEKYRRMQEHLKRLDSMLNHLSIEPRELIERSYACWFVYDLYEEIEGAGKEELAVGVYKVGSKKRMPPEEPGIEAEIGIMHPSGDRITIRKFKTNNLERDAVKHSVLLNGSVVLEVEYCMEYNSGVHAPIGHFYWWELKHIGTVLECVGSQWLPLLVETFFEVRAHLAARRMSDWLNKAETST